jgi:Zn-dependent peptidase ImmA (M78 family)
MRKREIYLEPPRLNWPFIRTQAETFRLQYVKPIDLVPVPIIRIVEIDLGIEPIPLFGLMDIDIDGFLTSDLKKICIDSEIYQNPRKESRLRFTLAHEVGHWVLHQEQIRKCAFRNPEDWMHFREDFLEEDLGWFEQQAYEFAGRLLVPKDRLMAEIHGLGKKIDEYRARSGRESEALRDTIAREICGKFGVSPGVIARRIRSEKIRIES